MSTLLPLLLATLLAPPAHAQSPAPPRREVPPSVFTELHQLERRFEAALAADCDAERCFPKGCTYLEHAVADRPRSTSLPGLGLDPGPGSVTPQAYLTRAQCAYAHEPDEVAGDTAALTRRLQAKLSSGWLAVSVSAQRLEALPSALRQAPDAEPEAAPAPAPAPAPVPEEASPRRELWEALLPHFYWMIALGLITLSAVTLIWAWRRVGRASLEEQALLAQLAAGGELDEPPPEGAVTVEDTTDEDAVFVAAQEAAWRARLDEMDPGRPDPALQELIRERLRAGDLSLLAKAVLRFPDGFPRAFPHGGEIAEAKLALAEHLKTVDVDALPDDVDFFRALHRHAMSAALATQGDAQIVQQLREDFGASGLTQLIGQLPPRTGALLFALAPAPTQQELVQLLTAAQSVRLAEALLRSDRMAPRETDHLFAVLRAARDSQPLPPPPAQADTDDQGPAFAAADALSVLLPTLPLEARAELFRGALRRLNGSLPGWHRGIFTPDMLAALPAESRGDLLLEVDVESLAAWLQQLPADERARVAGAMPSALRASVGGVRFASPAQRLARAAQGRRALARGFQQKLARAGVPFASVVTLEAAGAP